MMWSTHHHDGPQESELVVVRQNQHEADSGHVEQHSSTFFHPSHPAGLRLSPEIHEVNKPGGALLLSSTIRPLVTAAGCEANNYYTHDRWGSSPSSDTLRSSKPSSKSSQSPYLLVDDIALKAELNIGIGPSSSLHTGSISNGDDMGVGRLISRQQQQGLLSSLSSEAVRSSMMTTKSHRVENSPTEEKEVPYHALHFPWRLHQMLEAAESHGFSHIVSWLPELQDHHNYTTTEPRSGGRLMIDSNETAQQQSPHSRKKRIAGTPFRVHEPGIFEKVIMPRFFRQTKFKSFRRQINLWSFERIRNGPNKGGYQNDYFVRTNASLCARMRRSKSKRPVEDHGEELATHSAASSLIVEQQQEVKAIGNNENPGVSSRMLRNQQCNPTKTTTTSSCTTAASIEHDTSIMISGEEPTTRTATTNMDQHHFTGNSLSSSSLSWFESHAVSLLNYAYAVIRDSQNTSVTSADPAPSSNHSSTADIEQELISTFFPAFHMLLDKDDDTKRDRTF